MNLVPFGSACTLQNGRAFKPGEWSDSGTPIVRIQNLNDESKPFNYCNFEVEKRFHIDTGDLLFSWSGTPGTSFGAFFWNRGKGFLNQHIFRVDVDEANIRKNYLRYAINSKLTQIIDQAHGGVGLKHITKGKLEAVEIPLPPLAEQKRIAAILDKADAIRRKRQQAIQLADQFLRAVFLDMFGDPVTNPKGWEVTRIDKLCTIVRGSSPRPKGDPRYYGGPIPRLMVADLTRDGKFVTPKIDSLTEEGSKKSRPVNSGTVVMAVSGNVGLTSVLAIDACIHDGFIAFNDLDSEKIVPSFLQELMMFLKSTHANRQAGAIFQNLTTSQIKEMEIPLPPISLQMRYLQVAKKTGDMKINGGDLPLFESLSQKAFAGEL